MVVFSVRLDGQKHALVSRFDFHFGTENNIVLFVTVKYSITTVRGPTDYASWQVHRDRIYKTTNAKR